MGSLYGLDGPKKFNVNSGSRLHTLDFINTSAHNICDIVIRTFDDDFYGATPEIKPDNLKGLQIHTWTPESFSLPDGTKHLKTGTKTKLEASGYDRTDSDSESDETTITLKNCIEPGKGISLSFKLDETLDGNEGFRIAPSHKIDDDHYTFGGSEVEDPAPVTWLDFLKFLGEIGKALPIGGLLGKVEDKKYDSDVSLAKLMRNAPTETVLALRSAVHEEFFETRASSLRNLPLVAIKDLDKDKAYALDHMGFKTINDLFSDVDIQKMIYLYHFNR